MGRLVGVVAMTHNPRIFSQTEAADADSRRTVDAMFDELRRRLTDAGPDRLLVIGNDHLNTFCLDRVPAFCVGLAARAEGPFWYEAEILRIPRCRTEIDVDLGEHLLDVGMRRGVELAQAREFGLDHAFCVPLSVVRPEADLPIVPVFTNVFVPPLPRGRRFLELGEAVGALVRERPQRERIAVVTSFNLSLDVGGPKMGRRDEEFNRQALDLMRRGRAAEIVEQFPVERLVEAGNSTTEFLNYFVVLGLVEDRPPDFLQFLRVPAWGDCPGVAWSLA